MPWRDLRGAACGFCSIKTKQGVKHRLCSGKHCACHNAGHPATGNPNYGKRHGTQELE